MANLKKELEATFKEDISIYFDENPHDGLLETHHVDKSLEGKLKCLIFIPIISQTYCDQKSFAWQQEFCAFNELAKKDQFGREVKLSNGNVASRILPIKIHGLDAGDQKALETEIGSALRAVEFIYKEPGVNRPLSPDDDPSENLNKTKYRNQVNKVANAVKEIIEGLKNFDNPDFYSPSHEAETAETKSPLSKSIVVLPFEDMSPEKDQEYFCDGLAEELINALSKIKDLHVVARTSAFSFKGKKIDVREIGGKLNVEYLLEGSVRKSRNHLRITVQLISVADGYHIWSEGYSRDLEDVLVLQSDLAQAIAREIKVVVTPEESRRLANARRVNPEAYEAYLKGRFHWYMYSPEHAVIALQHFQIALEKDPNYALAHGAIGDTWGIRTSMGLVAPREAYPHVKTMEEKILQLDDTSAEVHDLVGRVRCWFEWDWPGAEQEYRRAIELNPSYADARVFYCLLLSSMKQWEEAEAQIKHAIKLDPLNCFFQWHFGKQLFLQWHNDEAITQFHNTLRMEPNFPLAQLGLWCCFQQKSMPDKALTAAEVYFGALHGPEIADALTRGFTKGGYSGSMRLAAQTLAERFTRSFVQPTLIARLYLYAGESDEALNWLEKGYEERDFEMVFLGVDPTWENLRASPRFQKLIKEMNFPKVTTA